MLNPPKTKAAALKYRYNHWAGNPNGTPYRAGRCAYEAYTRDRMAMFYQCTRKPGKGPDGLYCVQHAKKVEELTHAR